MGMRSLRAIQIVDSESIQDGVHNTPHLLVFTESLYRVKPIHPIKDTLGRINSKLFIQSGKLLAFIIAEELREVPPDVRSEVWDW